jgi:prepilin-type N-terminal cleavage/methylation domain-containing protein
MQKRTRWFTLIELIIVMVIIGILSVILLRTYTWISQIVFRVQQTRNVHQEVLQVSQIVQNFADNDMVDFSQYTWLATTQWLTSVLYLKGRDGSLSFYVTGECASPMISGNLILTWRCYIAMVQSWELIQLTDPNKVNIRNLVFKIIPFASESAYLSWTAYCEKDDYLHCIHKPWFRILFDAYSINYGTQWTNKVYIPFQLFY